MDACALLVSMVYHDDPHSSKLSHLPSLGHASLLNHWCSTKTQIQGEPVGDIFLRRQLNKMGGRAPVLHCFGHVHAQQFEEEGETEPRFMADAPNGILFLNCAAERQLPSISSAALEGQRKREEERTQQLKRDELAQHQERDEIAHQEKRQRTQHPAATAAATAVEGSEEAEDARKDAMVWLRPPVLLRIPLKGRFLERMKDDDGPAEDDW